LRTPISKSSSSSPSMFQHSVAYLQGTYTFNILQARM
jgi:hypothetical protein